MEGYGPTTCGDRIADVYDAFHEETLDTDRAVETLAELAGSGPVLELAIGTGRLAWPLAERASRCRGSTPRSGWSRGSGRSPAATRSRSRSAITWAVSCSTPRATMPSRSWSTAQHVVITEGGTKLYPVSIRYTFPSELHLMARLAGPELRERWGSWRRDAFTAESGRHVSVYAR